VRGPLRRVRAVAGDGLFTRHIRANWSKAHNILLQRSCNAHAVLSPSMVDIAEQS